MNAVERLKILPRYGGGAIYMWTTDPALEVPGPYTFVVEEAPAASGPWTAISPPLVNKYHWVYDSPRLAGKEPVLYYRVKMTASSKTWISDYVLAYGELSKREWLIAKEIIRKETLTARKFEGVEGQVYQAITFGPRCTACLDPITGNVRSGKCSTCFGTGRSPAYSGPIPVWIKASITQAVTHMSEGGSGTKQPAQFQLRVIGAPPLKTNDLIIDKNADRRYYVEGANYSAEVRRIPVVQTVQANEAPKTDIAYKVGL